MCLINVAHEHFITQAGKKSKPTLINFMGPRADTWGRAPKAEKNKYPVFRGYRNEILRIIELNRLTLT